MKRFHETFDIVGRHSKELFAPHLELHVLDLSLLAFATVYDDAPLKRWGRFLLLKDVEQARLLAEEDPIMNLAITKLEDLSNDPVIRRLADDRERDLLAHGHFVATAREQGAAEAMLAAIEMIAEVLGVELTAARRRELARANNVELRRRLESLRTFRAWV